MFNQNGEIIREYIKKLALNKRLAFFYVTDISNNLLIPIDKCFEELNKLVSEEILYVKYEIRTLPGLDVIEIVDNYENLLDTTIMFEDTEYNISYDNIFPIYYISDEYKRFVADTKNKFALSP